MNIQLTNGFSISDIRSTDKATYIEHFREKEIYDHTLAIPYPYTEADAEWWVNRIADETAKQGRSVSWAIRDPAGKLMGGIGFHGLELGKSYKAELGYWLAKPFWGRGIMTEAVDKICEFAFGEFQLIRITANVFIFNGGSARVLEKAGFELEGTLRKNYRKDGKVFDGKLYAKVNSGHCNSD